MREVECKTIMDDLATKKNTVLEEAAKTLATYVKDRVKDGKSVGLHSDVLKMTAQFTPEERTLILALTLEYMGKSGSSKKNSESTGSFTGSSPMQSKRNKNDMSGSRFGSWGF